MLGKIKRSTKGNIETIEIFNEGNSFPNYKGLLDVCHSNRSQIEFSPTKVQAIASLGVKLYFVEPECETFSYSIDNGSIAEIGCG